MTSTARRATPLSAYAWLMRSSLLIGATAGFAYGLAALLAIGLGLGAGVNWLVVVQTHGYAQLLGFVALFILAVGSILFPRLRHAELARPSWMIAGGGLVATGVVARCVAVVLDESAARSALLAIAAATPVVGLALCVQALRSSCAAGHTAEEPWELFGKLGFGSLAATALLEGWIAIQLIGQPNAIAPFGPAQAASELGLWGFGVGITFAVGMRIFPKFLILREPRTGWALAVALVYGGGVGLVALSWLAGFDAVRPIGWSLKLAGVGAYLAAIRLFEPATRESGRPWLTNPTRLWTRIAAGFLMLGVVAGWLDSLGAIAVAETAVRHAVATGYLLPLMAFMAGRMLPGYSADAVRIRWMVPLTVWTLLAGAGLRVLGLLAGGYEGEARWLVMAGGVVTTAGFVILAVPLWRSTFWMPGARP
jgi:hypothetical protein